MLKRNHQFVKKWLCNTSTTTTTATTTATCASSAMFVSRKNNFELNLFMPFNNKRTYSRSNNHNNNSSSSSNDGSSEQSTTTQSSSSSNKYVVSSHLESTKASISSELSPLVGQNDDLVPQRRNNKWDMVQFKKSKKKYPALKDEIPLQPLRNAETSLAYKNAKILSASAMELLQVEDRSTHYQIFPKGDPEWQKITEALLAPAELALEMKKRALRQIDIEESKFFSPTRIDRSRYNIDDWNLLIRAQTAQNRFDLTQQTFEKILSAKDTLGVQPNVVTFTAMIHACAMGGGADAHKLAFNYFKQMKMMNTEPTIATYGALVHSFTNANKINEAFELIEAMRARDIEPNNVIHSTVLAACVKSGDLTRAWQHFELMNSKYAVEPDEVTLSIMMHAAARAGQAERALRIFKQFDMFLLTPTSVTYHTLMMALAKRKEHRWRVFETADQMELHGHKPSIYTFNILCYACAKDGNVKKIPSLLAKMQLMDIQADTYTYNTLITAYRVANINQDPQTHNQNITDALAMFDLMSLEGVQITLHTLNATLGVLASALRINRAIEFFETKFKEHNMSHDAVTYTIMINMFARSKRLNDAEQYFLRFRKEHASQKPTYGMYKHMVLGYAKLGIDDKSSQWLNEMFSIDGYKFNPTDMILYQSTIRGADNMRRNNLEKNKNINKNIDEFLKVF